MPMCNRKTIKLAFLLYVVESIPKPQGIVLEYGALSGVHNIYIYIPLC